MPHPSAEADLSSLGYLDDQALASLDAWWRASNYLTVGQIYLRDNVLLRRPLAVGDIKPRLLGHWGTSSGLSFVYAHTSRMISATGQQTIFLAGPGHGGPALVAAVVGGNLYRDLSRRSQRRGGPTGPVPTVLHPWRHPESRLGSDAGFHP